MYKIRKSQIVQDIAAGMDDDELMAKYDIPPKLFPRVLQRLVFEKAVEHEDLYEKSSIYRKVVDTLVSRRHQRTYVPMALRVYEDETSRRGFVRDISESGLRVAGIEARVGEVLKLTLPLTEIVAIEPLRFEAVCRWSERKGAQRNLVVSGFEVTTTSQEIRNRLQKLIEFLSMEFADTHGDAYELQQAPHVSDLSQGTGGSTRTHEFSGMLNGVDILDLVHFVLLSGQKKVMRVRSSDGRQCSLHLIHGKIVHAAGEDRVGTEAFLECMSFPGGEFSTERWTDPGSLTIDLPGDFLLMEAARMRDEAAGGLGFGEHVTGGRH